MARDLAGPLVAGGLALVVGLVVGGMSPRAEVRALRTRIDAMEECGTRVRPSDVAGVFQGRPWESRADRPDPIEVEAPADEPVEPVEGEVEADPSAPDADPDVDGPPTRFGEGNDPELDAMRDAMAIRSRAAWRALDEQAAPTPEQRAAIEDAVQQMNDELGTLASDLVTRLQAGENPERRDLMIFAADTLETMITTEDTIFSSLTPEQRDGVDADVLDPTAYVDASVVEILQQMEGMR